MSEPVETPEWDALVRALITWREAADRPRAEFSYTDEDDAAAAVLAAFRLCEVKQ